jgi:hypothetical protein
MGKHWQVTRLQRKFISYINHKDLVLRVYLRDCVKNTGFNETWKCQYMKLENRFKSTTMSSSINYFKYVVTCIAFFFIYTHDHQSMTVTLNMDCFTYLKIQKKLLNNDTDIIKACFNKKKCKTMKPN